MRQRGERHHRARIPDAIVRRLRDLHEFQGLTYRKLAELFGLNPLTVKAICLYTRRVNDPPKPKATA